MKGKILRASMLLVIVGISLNVYAAFMYKNNLNNAGSLADCYKGGLQK